MTASHIFKFAGNPNYCFIYRVIEPHKKYKAHINKVNHVSDVAELSFSDNVNEKFNFLRTTKNPHIETGYEVAIVGFPQLMPGHKSVSVKPCRIVNTFVKSTFTHKEIDVDIHGGNSGGPVVDGYMDVVGMAVMGVTVSFANGERPEEKWLAEASIFRKLFKLFNTVFLKIKTRSNEEGVKARIKGKLDPKVALEGTNAFIDAKHLNL